MRRCLAFHDLPLFNVITVQRRMHRNGLGMLADKTVLAFNNYQPKSVIIAGGVAANAELRRILSDRLPIKIEYAPMNLCTDDAAMTASLGYYQMQYKQPVDPYSLEVVPSLSMVKK